MDVKTIFSICFGVSVILICSVQQFGSWTEKSLKKYKFTDNPRHYTTFIRFNFYQLVYIAMMMAFYLLLIYFPDILMFVPADKTQTPGDSFWAMFTNYKYLMAAFLISGFFPYFPAIKSIETTVRDHLHKKALVPVEAIRIMANLETHQEAFQPNDEDIEKTLLIIGPDRFSKLDFKMNWMDSIRHKWCRLSYFTMLIREHKTNTEFIKFLDSCDQVICDYLEKGYAELKRDMNTYLELIEKRQTNDPQSDLATKIEVETHIKLNTLLKSCYRLISCGVLATKKLNHNRIRAFLRFGLDISMFKDPKFFDFDVVLRSAIVIFSTSFFPAILYYYTYKITGLNHPAIYPDTAFKAFQWSLLGLVMFTLGLSGVVVMAKTFGKINANEPDKPAHHDKPLVQSCISGLIGYAMGFCTLFLFLKLWGRSMDNPRVMNCLFLYPMLPALSSAMVTRFILSPMRFPRSKTTSRVAEASLTALVTGVCGLSIPLVLDCTCIASLAYITATSAFIGFGVSYVSIEALRANLLRKNDRRGEVRRTVSEKARLKIDDRVIDCRIISRWGSGCLIDRHVPGSKTSARLYLNPLGEIPVMITKRYMDKTVLTLIMSPFVAYDVDVDIMQPWTQLKAS